jgi:hypothetical protein
MQEMADLRDTNGQGSTDGVAFLRFHVELAEEDERCYPEEEVVRRADRCIRNREGDKIEVDFNALEERVPDTLHWRDLRKKQNTAQNCHDGLDTNGDPDHHTLSGAKLAYEPSLQTEHTYVLSMMMRSKKKATQLLQKKREMAAEVWPIFS